MSPSSAACVQCAQCTVSQQVLALIHSASWPTLTYIRSPEGDDDVKHEEDVDDKVNNGQGMVHSRLHQCEHAPAAAIQL
eukprot:1157957-Pelagomonas_calceolata.AAC.9